MTGSIYLEIDYKNDIPMEVGIFGINSLGEDVPRWEFSLFRQDNWNKIYLKLGDSIQLLDRELFRFAFRGIIPIDADTNDFELENAEILIDNIKLIHF